MKNTLLVYTRDPEDTAVYSEKLAYSMHMALDRGNGDGFVPLNHNYGVLFVRATENENGTLLPMCLDKPFVFRCHGGGFGVISVCVRPRDGIAVPDDGTRGFALVSFSKDLVRYTDERLLALSGEHIEDIMCVPADNGAYAVRWRDADGCHEAYTADFISAVDAHDIDGISYDTESPAIEGIRPRNTIVLTDGEADYLYKKLTVPENVAIELPDTVEVASRDELTAVRAVARYSDGTSAKKRVDWYDGGVDYTRPGEYKVRGRIHQDRFEFPISWDRADPCIGKWEGKYYFIATNDRDGNNSLSIRCSDTIPGLATAQETEILNTRMYPHMKGLLWAPEFHIIGGRLYIFHAATADGFPNEQSHVMALKQGGNPMIASDWEPSRRVVKADGSPLFTLGITLDMTVFSDLGRYYVVWSQRRYDPVDFGAWLYIAELSEEEPWRILTEPVAISRPDYGWANNHTPVDEGPYALITEDKIYLTFSSAAVDSTYVVGMLTAEHGADLLSPDSWQKLGYPLLSSASVPGQYGTGHNSYVTDEYGDIWNAYHGRPGIHAPRSTGIRRVHFDIDGAPRLDLTEDRDLSPRLADVSVMVIVK